MVPAIAFTIYDRLLGHNDDRWNKHFKKVTADVQQQEADANDKLTRDRIPNTTLSHPLDDYMGEYEHPGYGIISVKKEGDQLIQVFNGLTNGVKHYHYDSFETTFGIEMRDLRTTLTYTLNAPGEIVALSVPFEPLLAPITFKKRRA
jgi:uncharacterized protein DUF3471